MRTLIILFFPLVATAQLTPDSLLALSIDYHDPDGSWGSGSHLIKLVEERPGGTDRESRLVLYPGLDDFEITQQIGNDKTRMRLRGGTYDFSLNGNMELRAKDIEKHRLTEERLLTLRDYYTYLYGLPMKLRDPGTKLGNTVKTVTDSTGTYLELEVGYAAEVGKDIWHFRFDPETYALRQYRFYHAVDGSGTGEYILLDGEAEVNGMKLPANRAWYYTENNKYLATDRIVD